MTKLLMPLLACALLVPGQLSAAPVLPKTGQTTCWDVNGNQTSCSGTGQDANLQTGVPWPAPRFVDNGNGTLSDRLTDLVWLRNADCYGSLGWQDALGRARALSSGACDLTDGSAVGEWRLPNRKELLSIVSFEQANGAAWLAGQGFVNGIHGWYWSSDSYLPSPQNKWVVHSVGAVWADNHPQITEREFHALFVRDAAGAVTASPEALAFGEVAVGSPSAPATVTITNPGTVPASVSGISVSGADGAMFTVNTGSGSGGTCGSLTPSLPAGGNCTLTVTFTPSAAGSRTASLHVVSNGVDRVVAAAGTGSTSAFSASASVLGGNGTISSPTQVSVAAGSTAQFSVTPAAGYRTQSVPGGTCPAGTFNGPVYTTGRITGNCTVIFSFTSGSFSISTVISGQGEVTCGPVADNAPATCSVVPSPGYHAASVSGCGGSLAEGRYTTAPVTANCTVTALFEADGLADAVKAFQHVMGRVQLSDQEKVRYDVAPLGADGKPAPDGAVDVGDVVIMLRRLSGVVNW